MRDRFAELQSHNLDVLIVICQKRASVARWLTTNPLPFPILLDEDRSRAKRWGVYVALSYDSIHMARPASFIVDRAGVVRYARISKNQMDPAPLEEILAVPGL